MTRFRLRPFWRRAILAASVATLAVAGLSAGSASSFASTTPLLVGTLDSNPAKAATENAQGVRAAMIELNWSAYETAPGVFSSSYASSFNKRVDTLLAAGQQVTLGLGLHYTPKWVLDLPNGRFVNQSGQASGAANFVFSADVRQRAANYLAKANAAMNFSRFSAIRITSGARSELLYPSGGTYWAFDAAAQTGVGLPAGVAKSPVPGWKPGTTALSKDQVRSWALWYVDSLASTAGWLTSTVRNLGYDNAFYLLTPGVGVTPVRFDQLTSGTTLPNGTLGVGAYWYEIYRQLKDVPGMTAYVSSMADGSGSNDSCSPSDPGVSMFTKVPANWSAARWIARIADEFGLPKSGENPGHHDSTAQRSFYTSTENEGMAGVVFRQARSCGFSSVFWAHDKQLWDGTMTLKDLTTAGGLS